MSKIAHCVSCRHRSDDGRCLAAPGRPALGTVYASAEGCPTGRFAGAAEGAGGAGGAGGSGTAVEAASGGGSKGVRNTVAAAMVEARMGVCQSCPNYRGKVETGVVRCALVASPCLQRRVALASCDRWAGVDALLMEAVRIQQVGAAAG